MSGTHLIGTTVGEYEVIRRIGVGGMGAVYEGRHPLIGKRVAIKVLLPQFSSDESQLKRFLAEARSVNEIRHRGIVDIFAFGKLADGSHYCVMEFLEGASFEALLRSRQSLPPAEALGLLEEVLDAVAAAHHAGVVHRDLKPSNIFLVDVGRGRPFVKLLDFGLAKLLPHEGGPGGEELTGTGIVGTPKYMAPEQVNGGRAGPESDIYALGVVLFELVAGRPPFEAATLVELMTRHVGTPPPRLSELKPGTPPDVDRLVERMLAKRPEDRPRDAESLRAEVAQLKARLEGPLRKNPFDDEGGETVVRVVRRGGPGTDQPEIIPLASRSVGRVEPGRRDLERTLGGNEASLPWGSTTGSVSAVERSTTDPGVSTEAVPAADPGTPTTPFPVEVRPVPTVPFEVEMPSAEKPISVRAPERPIGRATPISRPVPLPRPYSGSSPSAPRPVSGSSPSAPRRPSEASVPTLSANEAPEGETLPPEPKKQGPDTDRQPALAYSSAVAEAKVARDAERAQHLLSNKVLLLGLGAAGLVLLLLLLVFAFSR